MGRFIMSPEKFKTLEADAKHSDKITDLRMTGDYSGIIDTHDVSLEFNYDLGTQTLNFVVGKKHSLAAKMASDNVIERHVTEVLFNLESAPEVQAEVPEPVQQSQIQFPLVKAPVAQNANQGVK